MAEQNIAQAGDGAAAAGGAGVSGGESRRILG